jgi:hypothetical protein
MADAVASCLWESLPHRETKATLYEDRYYDKIFDANEVKRNLLAWHLWKLVQRRIRKSRRGAAREQGKWLAQFALWRLLSGTSSFSADRYLSLAKGPTSSAFRKANDDLIKEVADSIDAFYSATADKNDDPVRFFKTPNLAPRYDEYLASDGSKFPPAIKGRVAQLVAAMAV